ncbi:hypothetical protein NGM10_10440 [Halorussus salilacus]|uniref:hypothetical protein n=1 Tax=Halorussus salilacus TaxID=2953750 RepID=UPI0020A07E04|nr:hypothetical protein [Halorussus salilacus]USZ67148.1 hypothetical protein NGM10_10440 [Halorussus salilacus]
MTATETRGRITYRRAYAGLWILAGVLFGTLIGFGYELWAVAAFFALAGATLVLERSHTGTLFDERDETIHRIASAKTIGFYGVLSAVVFPALVALDALGMYEWGPMAAGVAWAVAVLYVTYAAMTVVAGRKR